jgi:hypothetical protein
MIAVEISPHLDEHSVEEINGFLERREPIP